MSETETTVSVRPKPIWWLVIIATLLATTLACVIGILTGDEVTSGEDFRVHGGQWTSLIELYYVLAVCAGAWLLTWLAFYVLYFRKRARLWKSIVALFAMLPFVFAIGILARVFTFEYYWSLDRDQVAEIREQSTQRLKALKTHIAGETGEFRIDRGIPDLHSDADVANALQRIREERARLRGYQQQATAELRQAKQRISDLDIYGEVKAEGLQHYDDMLTPTSNMNRHFALNFQLLDLQEAALLYLQQHHASWEFLRGTIAFTDDGALTTFNAKMRAAYDIIPQLDHLEGEGGPGIGASQTAPDATTNAPSP